MPRPLLQERDRHLLLLPLHLGPRTIQRLQPGHEILVLAPHRKRHFIGVPLFELRHANYLTENNWLVEAPSGRVLAKIKHVSRFAKERSALDVTILNEADAGREVELLVRPQDFGAISTVVTTAVQGVCIGEIKLTGSNDISDLSQADRSTWEVRVAGGVDLALVLVIALCRAEMHHVYRK
ncbi:hypothetical protein BKA65DRAFT_584993 [Rhexocercosporidium sp. MPI-PUGE-AT-0058]|nr:hypothetical protein BKA65DRAFT_584993 [Rhexocercosporidium sp. MPI-PUGE-AT-0058]